MKKYLFILFIFMIYSCASLGLSQDPGMKGLLYAKSEIASLAEQYEISYRNASPLAQLNWRNSIDPLFIQAQETIEEWEYYLKLDKDITLTKERYVLIRNAILKALVEIEKG